MKNLVILLMYSYMVLYKSAYSVNIAHNTDTMNNGGGLFSEITFQCM